MGFFKDVGNYAKGALFGSGGKGTNPYVAPNIDFLKEPAKTTDYSGLLKTTDASSPTGQAFSQYVGAINAPSSVDQVRSQMNQEQLANLIQGIQRDTNTTFGSEISKRFGMGQFEPGIGASSDISGNALAQIQAQGARTAADARLGYGLQDLERLAAREAELRDAYGQQYGTTNQNLLAYYSGEGGNTAAENARRQALAQILSGQAATSAGAYRDPTYGAVGKGLDAYATSYGQSLGSKHGGGGGIDPKMLASLGLA